MTKKQVLKKVEEFSKTTMDKVQDNVHNWEHVDRVRKWALKIGKAEGDVDLFHLEIAALLHDVGKLKESKKINHFSAGEKIVKSFLKSLDYFTDEEIKILSKSVYEHGPGGDSMLTKILQDADRMELIGAIGVLRTASCKTCNYKPFYKDKKDFEMKIISEQEIHKKCQNRNSLKSVLDHFELALSIINTMNTKTGKKLVKEKIKFTKEFIRLLKKETIDL